MDDLARYLGLFVSEATEHTEQLARLSPELSGSTFAGAAVDEVFRHAHSVKGMAAAMGFDEIVSLSHAAEQLLGELRQRKITLPAGPAGRLVEATDRLLEMIRARGEGRAAPPVPELVAALSAGALQPDATPAAPAPAATGGAADLATALKERLRGGRVRSEHLDAMLETAGELLLGVSRLREVSRGVGEPQRQGIEEAVDRMQRGLRELHGQVTTARLTALSVLTDQLPRHVREIARRTQRSIVLDVEGEEVEIDRSLIEDLADVLLHLLRNCVDHGIEPRDARLAAGKPEAGQLTVQAERLGDLLRVSVADDGRGFDPDKLRAAAVKAGRLPAELAAQLSDDSALELACMPGISTAREVTDISGRGIGLDAVKSTVEGLGGTFSIESRKGAGSRFELTLPLTMSLLQVLLAEVSGEIVALPIGRVHAAVDLPPPGKPLVFGGRDREVHSLADLLGYAPRPRTGSAMALVLGSGEARGRDPRGDGLVAVSIDRLVGQQEVVVKPLSRPLDRLPELSGVTLLGSGQPVFILEVGRLLPRA